MALTIQSGATLGPGVTLRGSPQTPVSYLPSTLFELDASSYTSGTTWTDSSGNSRNGSLLGGITWSSEAGGCFVFDGDPAKYIEIPGSEYGWGLANSPAQASFSVWANIPGNSYYQHIAGWRGGLNFWFLLLAYGSTTEARFDNGPVTDINMDYSPYYGSWAQTTFVVDAAQGRTKLYINGVDVGTGSSISGNFGAGGVTYTLGCAPNNGFVMTGKIGGSTAYNAALTDSEVLAEFNRTKIRYGL